MAFSPPASLATSQHFGHAGRDTPLFLPPKSPASVSATPAFATANSDYFGSSRKRQRGDSTHAHDRSRTLQTPWTRTSSWDPSSGDAIFSGSFAQSSGLVNERYRLADGFDTPSLQNIDRLTVNEDEFRTRLRDNYMGTPADGGSAPVFGPLARERNGVARMQPPANEAPEQKSWTSFAFGIVGKVFQFGSSAVRGFYAGGGQGYDIPNHPLVGSDLLKESTEHRSTPIPGSWHQDEFDGDFEQDSPAFMQDQHAPRPSNKRRQTDRDAWVVVGTPDIQESPENPRKRTSSSGLPRSSLAPRPSASRASSRRNAPTPRRGNSYVNANGSPAQPHLASPQPMAHNRRASIAPTRSPQARTSLSGYGANCMSPEAERYAKRQARQDRATDKAMNNMGKRMEDLIRQAQEALGTKISVEGDGMDLEDEGYVDDGW